MAHSLGKSGILRDAQSRAADSQGTVGCTGGRELGDWKGMKSLKLTCLKGLGWSHWKEDGAPSNLIFIVSSVPQRVPAWIPPGDLRPLSTATPTPLGRFCHSAPSPQLSLTPALPCPMAHSCQCPCWLHTRHLLFLEQKR